MRESPPLPNREKDLFLQALEWESPQDRSRFLDEACEGDEALRAAIEALLSLEEEPEDLLLDRSSRSALEEERTSLASDLADEGQILESLGKSIRQVGDYELHEELGRGAMGVVFRAKQRSLNRDVALKVILSAALASPQDRQRFRVEAEAAAHLEHPNIVPIFEVGRWEDHDFYSMALYRGGTLAAQIATRDFSPREAVELMLIVTRAVHAAHERGVIHRDLKPDNILLDEQGTPYVGDFGLACWLDNESNLTLSGQIMGTPQYMAPELTDGERIEASTQADIYALGAILYELLTKEPPFRSSSILTTLKMVKDQPARSLQSLTPDVDRDLDTMVLKCLEKKRNDRYPSARILADDLEAWLDHRPISARPPTTIERLKKWIQRRPVHAAFAATGALFILTLGIGGPLTAWKQTRLKKEAEAAQRTAEIAEREARDFAELTRKQARANRRLAYSSNIRLIALAHTLGADSKIAADTMIGTWLPRAGEDDIRGWEWFYNFGKIHSTSEGFKAEGPVTSLLFSHFGEWILCSHAGGTSLRHTLTTVLLRNFEDGEGHLQSEWAPDDSSIATLNQAGSVKIWNPETGEVQARLPATDPIICISWGADPHQIASLDATGLICIWNLAKGEAPEVLHQGHHPGRKKIAWSPDGSHLAAIGNSKEVFVWEASAIGSPPAIYQGHDAPPQTLDWQDDSKWLATGASSGVFRIWGVPGRQRIARGDVDKPHPITSIAWNPDGNLLVYVSEGSEKVIDVNLETSVTERIATSRGENTAIDWNPEVYTIATGNKEGKVQFFRHDLPKHSDIILERDGPFRSMHWKPDGTQLACLTGRGSIVRVNSLNKSTSPERPLRGFNGESPYSWNPGSGALAYGTEDEDGSSISIFRSGDRGQIDTIPLPFHHLAGVTWMSSQELIACGESGELHFWTARPQKNLPQFDKPRRIEGHRYREVSVSPDRKWILATGEQKRITLWSATSGAIVFDICNETHRIDESHHAWHPDSHSFATANGEGVITLWSVEDQASIGTIRAHQGAIHAIAWHPDGQRLASAGRRGKIHLWDTESRELTLSLDGHEGSVNDLAWDPEGLRLGSAGSDGTIRIWDATAGFLLSPE